MGIYNLNPIKYFPQKVVYNGIAGTIELSTTHLW